MRTPPLSRDLANEFSLYGVRSAKQALNSEVKLLKKMIQKNDETSLRRYLDIMSSKTKIKDLNREQVAQVVTIFLQELEFMIKLAGAREIAIAQVINNPSKGKEISDSG